MHLHRAFLCPYKRHFCSKAAILLERSTMNLEFRADGVTPHRGAHRQRQSAGSHRHQAGPTGPPSMPAPSWPAWSAAWPPPACTKRSSSWWVTTKPECSKRPSRMGGPFLLLRRKRAHCKSSQRHKIRTKSKRRQPFFNALPSLFWCTLRDSNPGPAD